MKELIRLFSCFLASFLVSCGSAENSGGVEGCSLRIYTGIPHFETKISRIYTTITPVIDFPAVDKKIGLVKEGCGELQIRATLYSKSGEPTDVSSSVTYCKINNEYMTSINMEGPYLGNTGDSMKQEFIDAYGLVPKVVCKVVGM